jgi:hypothetical protein
MEYSLKINFISVFEKLFEKKKMCKLALASILECQSTRINHFVKRIVCHKIIDCHNNMDVLLLYSLIYFMCLFKNASFQPEMTYPFYTVCFCISCKFLCDENYNNKTFSVFSGIDIKQFNQIEKFILQKIKYKLFIDYNKIKNMQK